MTRIVVRRAIGLLALSSLVLYGARAQADEFVPEQGVFGESSDFGPYELALQRVLLADDYERRCQLVTLPSFQAESAVYFLRPETGGAIVISRTLKSGLWSDLMRQMAETGGGSFSLDAASQQAALDQLRSAAETRRAPLDVATADLLETVCAKVLAGVHHPKNSGALTIRLDGTTYHAGHWIPGAFLTATAWSPPPGSIAREFVTLEVLLKAYAESAAGDQPPIKLALVSQANKILHRLRAAGRCARAA